VSTSLPGDFDFDGDVDGSDFLVWQRNTAVGDLADWQANYGTGIPLTAASTAVPEPSCWLLILLAAMPRIARRFPRVAANLYDPFPFAPSTILLRGVWPCRVFG
jgi:hypothetical protein